MTFARSPRVLTTLAVSAGIALAGLVGAEASVAKTYACTAPEYPDGKLGGYFTSLETSGFASKRSGCKTGQQLVVKYYQCRRKKGIKGRCTSKVLGYSCTEKRPSGSQSDEQLNAKVTCKLGSKKIVHTYQQNLT